MKKVSIRTLFLLLVLAFSISCDQNNSRRALNSASEDEFSGTITTTFGDGRRSAPDLGNEVDPPETTHDPDNANLKEEFSHCSKFGTGVYDYMTGVFRGINICRSSDNPLRVAIEVRKKRENKICFFPTTHKNGDQDNSSYIGDYYCRSITKDHYYFEIEFSINRPGHSSSQVDFTGVMAMEDTASHYGTPYFDSSAGTYNVDAYLACMIHLVAPYDRSICDLTALSQNDFYVCMSDLYRVDTTEYCDEYSRVHAYEYMFLGSY